MASPIASKTLLVSVTIVGKSTIDSGRPAKLMSEKTFEEELFPAKTVSWLFFLAIPVSAIDFIAIIFIAIGFPGSFF